MGEIIRKTLVVKTTKRAIDEITIDISDEACLPFGFLHGELVVCPDGLEAIIGGVSPGNDGINVLWYTKKHPAIKGRYCYYEGGGNLLMVGFKKKLQLKN